MMCVVTASPCVEAANPRLAGFCVRCGKRIDAPVRSEQYEREFLQQAAKIAAQRYGIGDGEGFVIAVSRRLADGQTLYGDSFMEKDGAKEIGEEGQDVGAYGVLDAQKRIALDDVDDETAWHLFECVVHAAAIDWHSRQARKDRSRP